MRGAGALLVHDNGGRLVGHCELVCGGPLRMRRWLSWEEAYVKGCRGSEGGRDASTLEDEAGLCQIKVTLVVMGGR